MRNEEEPTLADIQAEVQRACDLLLGPTPAAVDGCGAAIGSAISRLGEWRAGFSARGGTAKPRLLEDALQLKAAVRRAGRLLRNAAEYHARWRQSLGAVCGGYTASGAPAALPPAGRLLVRG